MSGERYMLTWASSFLFISLCPCNIISWVGLYAWQCYGMHKYDIWSLILSSVTMGLKPVCRYDSQNNMKLLDNTESQLFLYVCYCKVHICENWKVKNYMNVCHNENLPCPNDSIKILLSSDITLCNWPIND